jgi:hypothetical protein
MTTDIAEPTGWEIAAQHIGFEGMTATQAGRANHLLLLPLWEALCTCWQEKPDLYRSPGHVVASDHVRCHQKTCDLHEGAVARWEETQKTRRR